MTEGFPSTDQAKRIAELELQTATATKDVLLTEHSESFRWLMASLLAVNGAGLIGVKDLPLSTWSAASAAAFYLGIACALLVAWFGQKGAQAMLAPLSELIGFWTVVSVSGEYVEDLHKALLEKVRKSMLVSRRSSRAGWMAFLAFTIGLIFCGAAVATKPLPVSVRSIGSPTSSPEHQSK